MPRKKAVSSNNWEVQFEEILRRHHKRNIKKLVAKLVRRATSTRASLIQRSKKYEVECEITVDQLCQLICDRYGTPCKYSKRVLTHLNMVFDHIIPISKGGTSNIENIQLISKFSNGMKGSLQEDMFYTLLNWLDTVPEELKQDISIRLAGGLR